MVSEIVFALAGLIVGFPAGFFYCKHYSQKRDGKTGRFVSTKE